jgi:hypothetical protein
MNESDKLKIYKKWMESGFKQPSTQEELDIIIELQSKGTTEELKRKNQHFKDNQGKIPRTFPKRIFDKKKG